MHFWTVEHQARKRGAKIVTIDPYRSADRGEVRLVAADPPRHRRGPRPGRDAHPLPRGLAGRRLPRPHCLGAKELRERVLNEYPAARVSHITGLPVADIEQFAREYGRSQRTVRRPGADPPELRPAAARRRRHGGAHHHLPARGHRRLAASRRRGAAQHEQGVPVRRQLPRAARPDPAGHAHDQHGAARRGAARRAARPAGAGAVTSTTRTRPRSARTSRACCRGCAARTCSPSSTSSSRPTPPTTPTSCCRRRRNSNTSTSTAATATCTCRRTTRRSPRSGEAKPNTEVFRLLARAMGFEPELFEVSDEELAGERSASRERQRPEADRTFSVRRHHPRRRPRPGRCA